MVQIFLLWKSIESESKNGWQQQRKIQRSEYTLAILFSFLFRISLFLLFLLVCVQPVFIGAHSSMVTLWLSWTAFSLSSSLARSNSIERHSRAEWRGYSLQFDGIDDGDNIVSECVVFLLSSCFALRFVYVFISIKWFSKNSTIWKQCRMSDDDMVLKIMWQCNKHYGAR